MASGYRQGQAPFSGQVPPPGTALVLQEEFTFGVGAYDFGGSDLAGLQELPARWRPWVVSGAPEQWLDAKEQRFMLWGDEPTGEGQIMRWQGSLLPFPNVRPYLVPEGEEEPDEINGLLTVLAGVGSGPGLISSPWFPDAKLLQNLGLIVSGANLIAAASNAFLCAGLRQSSDPAGTPAFNWRSEASLGSWLDPVSFPNDETLIEVNATGLLIRLDLAIAAELDAPGGDIVAADTDVLASFSTDNGASWVTIGAEPLKGGPGLVQLPTVIGFAASGARDDGSGQIQTSRPTAAFDFLRVYARNGEEGEIAAFENLAINPDGGRNWP